MQIIKTGTLEQAQIVEAKICENVGIPDGAGTDRWSEIYEHPDGWFYISAPTIAGWGAFTFEQMMAGIDAEVVDYTVEVIINEI